MLCCCLHTGRLLAPTPPACLSGFWLLSSVFCLLAIWLSGLAIWLSGVWLSGCLCYNCFPLISFFLYSHIHRFTFLISTGGTPFLYIYLFHQNFLIHMLFFHFLHSLVHLFYLTSIASRLCTSSL